MAVQAELYPEIYVLPICGPQQGSMVDNKSVSGFGSDFCFDFQEQQNQSLFLHNLVFAQLEMQSQELDCMLQSQNRKLRSILQEQTEQQLAILESQALSLMRQKEEGLAEATKKTMELQAWLRKTQMESESWQRHARANEAMVMDLSNTLKQVTESPVLVSNKFQDAESSFSCGGSCDKEQTNQNHTKMACKSCNTRISCFLFLPCRHLCSCKSCEAFLGSCPVCNSVKQASMEVFWV